MRSGTNCIITSGQVYSWTLESLLQARLVKDHGWLCTATVVLGIVLRAAARSISVSAACRDLGKAPSDQAVLTALEEGLPQTLPLLERRLNDASVCIVEYGWRYTLALTWVQRHHSMVAVLRRLIARVREIGLKTRRVLLDRAFFNVPVVEFLQEEKLPFLMPVVMRGRRPKRGRTPTGLRSIQRQRAGWYSHTMKNKQRQVNVSICVGYRRHRNRKDGTQVRQKLLFAAWREHGSPTEIRQRYRQRFGIETSYRQMRQARIYTCTRSPHLRLFSLAVALILRNLWVWIHQTRLAEGSDHNLTLHLERLRFKRMLDWIAHEIVALFHDGSTPYALRPP